MGVKISSLPVNTLSYTGAEQIPLVQGGETRAGTLSSFVTYLSASFVTYLSASSVNYAVKDADNNFTATQTISSLKTNRIVFDNNTPSELVIDNSLNTYIGQQIQPDGTDDIIIGSNITTTTGSEKNIVIGYHFVGAELTLNSSNDIYIGHGTYNSNTVAELSEDNSYNTVIGAESGISDNAGSATDRNTILGYSNNSTGAGNIIVGTGNAAGFDDCIILGNGATAGQNNELVIGNGITPLMGYSSPSHSLPVRIGDDVYYIILTAASPP
jgi:hypothetical protein